jgi:hypothetical protein
VLLEVRRLNNVSQVSGACRWSRGKRAGRVRRASRALRVKITHKDSLVRCLLCQHA